MASDLSRLLESANAPIFSVDLERRVVSWTRRCAQITSLAAEDVLHQPLEALCPPEYHGILRTSCEQIVAGEKQDKFELAIYTQNRSVVQQLLVNCSVQREVDGTKCGLIFIGQDITELLCAIKTAKQISRDYERMFASAAIPIFGIDLEGRVSEWNDATAKCFGLEPHEVLGRPLIGKHILKSTLYSDIKVVNALRR
jgi:PAS domain S-box-containing protein